MHMHEHLMQHEHHVEPAHTAPDATLSSCDTICCTSAGCSWLQTTPLCSIPLPHILLPAMPTLSRLLILVLLLLRCAAALLVHSCWSSEVLCWAVRQHLQQCVHQQPDARCCCLPADAVLHCVPDPAGAVAVCQSRAVCGACRGALLQQLVGGSFVSE